MASKLENTTDDKLLRTADFKLLVLFAYGVWGVLAGAGVISYLFHDKDVSEDWVVLKLFDNLGVFGDSFGIVTSFVSLLTLIVAFHVFKLQRVELERTSTALKMQQLEISLARNEDRINEAIADYSRVVANICLVDKQGQQWRGTDALFHLWKTLIFRPLRLNKELSGRLPKVKVFDEDDVFGLDMFAPSFHLDPYDPDRAGFSASPIDPSWVYSAAIVVDESKSAAWEIASPYVRDQWEKLYFVHRYQIEPLLSVFLHTLKLIVDLAERELTEAKEQSVGISFDFANDQSGQRNVSRHLHRFLTQLSTTELNFILCSVLFNVDDVGDEIAVLADQYGVFYRYQSGIDATEVILEWSAKQGHRLDHVFRQLDDSAFTKGGVAFNLPALHT